MVQVMNASAAAIIPAAGRGSRMKSDQPKQFHMLAGSPILIHTVRAFLHNQHIGQCIIVVPEDWLAATAALLREYGLKRQNLQVTTGGRRRQDSVEAGLKLLNDGIDIVLVHDGARPLVSQDLIDRCLQAAKKHGAAIAAIPVKDTLKRATTDGRQISATIDRQDLWQAQTPQAMQRNLLEEAFRESAGKDVTDESSLLELAGIPVVLVEGSETNLKITRPEDLLLAEKLIQSTHTPRMKIGHGFDAHRFTPGRPLVLGGVTIPHNLGLAGHSDADVVTHALCDAILGALGARDIGHHFPDSDARFAGIYSILLLEKVMEYADEQAFSLGNADITIVCQTPRLAAHIETMREILAKTCRTNIRSMNVKATTTEKMGYTGREEGISCHAVVLLESRKYS